MAGGENGTNYLSSTEILIEGEHHWKPAGSLPRSMVGMRAVTVDNNVILTGLALNTDFILKSFGQNAAIDKL